MPETETTQTQEQTTEPQGKTFTQQDLDHIVKERLSRERQRYADYEDLQKFKAEHSKAIEAQQQKDMEARQEYDKVKSQYQEQIEKLNGLVAQKDTAIKSMQINTSLMGEITRQNAYAEEVLALIKDKAILGEDGTVRIKGKDSNGFDAELTVEAGIKQFLEQRPHLVKGSTKSGADTAPGVPGAGTGALDLSTLNQQLQDASMRGDFKRANEIKAKLKSALGNRGAI